MRAAGELALDGLLPSARGKAQGSHASTTNASRYEVASSSSGGMTHRFLESKFQVGSVKSQKISFSVGQKVFHNSDVPREAAEAKRAIEKSKKANILDLEQQAWNQSTIFDQKVQKDRKDLQRHLLLVRAGMDQGFQKPAKAHSDESIAQLQRYIVGVTGKGPIGKCSNKWVNSVDERGLSQHSIADHWPDWNHSAATHTKDDVKQAQSVYDVNDQRRQRMLAREPKLDVEAYVDPAAAVRHVNDGLREQKVDGQDLKEQIKRECQVEFPQASEERLQAMAQRLMHEKSLADQKSARFPVQHESFRPNVRVTTQDRRYKEFFHPGAWTYSEVEGCHAWSCCLNYGEKSAGCSHKVVNPDAWCYLGYERQPCHSARGGGRS